MAVDVGSILAIIADAARRRQQGGQQAWQSIGSGIEQYGQRVQDQRLREDERLRQDDLLKKQQEFAAQQGALERASRETAAGLRGEGDVNAKMRQTRERLAVALAEAMDAGNQPNKVRALQDAIARIDAQLGGNISVKELPPSDPGGIGTASAASAAAQAELGGLPATPPAGIMAALAARKAAYEKMAAERKAGPPQRYDPNTPEGNANIAGVPDPLAATKLPYDASAPQSPGDEKAARESVAKVLIPEAADIFSPSIQAEPKTGTGRLYRMIYIDLANGADEETAYKNAMSRLADKDTVDALFADELKGMGRRYGNSQFDTEISSAMPIGRPDESLLSKHQGLLKDPSLSPQAIRTVIAIAKRRLGAAGQ